MRIVKKAKVYLVGRTEPVTDGIKQFLAEANLMWPTPNALGLGSHEMAIENGKPLRIDHLDVNKGLVDMGIPGNETLIELFGRSCYMSFGNKAGTKDCPTYLANLIGLNREGVAHGSVTEHVSFNFMVIGGGRGFSHEQVRHRAGWAYSQLSTRYCDFEREEEEGTWDPGFTIPPLAQLSDVTSEFMEKSFAQSRENYKVLLKMVRADLKEKFKDKIASMDEREGRTFLRKAARGVARDLLPIATEAIMGMTGNLRAIWNALVLRASDAAEASIRDIYIQIARIMEKELPHIYKGLEYKKAWDGTDCVVMPRDKL